MLSATPWLPSTSDVVDRVSDEAVRTQPEAAYVAPSETGMRDAVVDSVMIINPDSYGWGDHADEGYLTFSAQPTDSHEAGLRRVFDYQHGPVPEIANLDDDDAGLVGDSLDSLKLSTSFLGTAYRPSLSGTCRYRGDSPSTATGRMRSRSRVWGYRHSRDTRREPGRVL